MSALAPPLDAPSAHVPPRAPPPAPSAAPPPAASDVAPLSPPDPLALAVGLSGYLVLGAVFALGHGALADAATVFVGALGAVAFTLPALLVLHGSLGLPSGPGVVAGALLRSLADTGRVALACTPVAGLFVAAGQIVPVLHVLAAAAVGGLGLWTGARALRTTGPGGLAQYGLVAGWVGVTGVVGVTLMVSWIELSRG